MTKQSDTTFILDKVKELLKYQRSKIVDYINESMTNEQRELHETNLLCYVITPEMLEAKIKCELLADGRRID